MANNVLIQVNGTIVL